jgi:membrane-bound lytic murein transglycosylase A
MHKNPSYVFFRILDGENVGSHNVPLTAGRTIATDPKYFPKGALAFIKLRIPVFSEEGNGVNWTPISRFVLNQDAGGAIKGTGRVDLFCGTGVDAERVAGSIREEGALYFLLKKKTSPALK